MNNENQTQADADVSVALPAKRGGHTIGGLVCGFVGGLVVAGLAVWLLMPGMMIITEPSAYSYGETVAQLREGISAAGWSSPGELDLNKSLAKKGVELEPRVTVVQLCKPEYARDVLLTDRYVSCLMPCAISVWEDDSGQVYVSKMNTGLMGKLFGGNIAAVMGGKVAQDEQQMLARVLAQ